MLTRVLLIISNLVVMGLFGWILLNSRRPLCIDSRLVEKVDILTSQGQDSVWSCRMRRSVPFNPFLHEMLPHIKARLQDVDSVLKAVGPLHQALQIQIDLVHPWVYEVVDHTITIGQEIFLSEGHLEKAMFKVWYRERQPDLFAYSSLAEEGMTDFLLFLGKGELGIEDRLKGYRTKIGGAHWPQVLKNLQAYCDSPWKLSEHFRLCEQPPTADAALSEKIMELSLRPLVSSSLIESYKDLDFADKNRLLKNFSSFVSSRRQPPLNLIGAMWESHPSAIFMGREILKEIQEFLFRADETRTNPSFKMMVTRYTENLRKMGFQEASSEVYFDFIYESAEPVLPRSELFAQLKTLSENHKDQQIALVDKKNIWFLPSGYAMDLSLFAEIRSHQRVVERCGAFDFGFVLSYAEKTEKMLVIDSCKKTAPQQLEAYLAEGAEGFARNNKTTSFVQFHIPSLMLKSDSIPASQNVLALIQNRDINSPVLQALGWQSLQWEQKVDAYRPKAQVEAIQWFRF